MSYGQAVRAWARTMLPEHLKGQEVVDVTIDYERGFGGTEFTPADDPVMDIVITLQDSDGSRQRYMPGDNGPEDVAIKFTELLQQLLKIEDQSLEE